MKWLCFWRSQLFAFGRGLREINKASWNKAFMSNVAVLGAGQMGTAVAQLLAQNGHKVWLWDYNPETIKVIKEKGENPFLPDIKLSKRIKPEISMQLAVARAELIVLAASSPYMRATAKHLSHCLETHKGKIVIAHIAKGLEEKTFLTIHEIVQSELPANLWREVVTISGPSIAKELVRGAPTAVVAASKSPAARELVRKIFESKTFRVATSADIKGEGICGALKNVYAIALGMCDGMQLTMNAKAFMLTVVLSEMEEIAQAFGGKRETVYGLAGLGDMIVTGLGDGRNRALGERICRDGSCKFVFKEKEAQTHEGVAATKVTHDFLVKKKIRAPLAEMVYSVIYRGADPCAEIKKFFAKIKLS